MDLFYLFQALKKLISIARPQFVYIKNLKSRDISATN